MPPTPTYTTIPISGIDAIFRLMQNPSASLSRCRPWQEFLPVVYLPPSLSAASLRLRRNAAYFSFNYAIIMTACVVVSLISMPIALMVLRFVFFLWLILHFFREDPLLVCGRDVSDWVVIAGLVMLSILALWMASPLHNLSIGVIVGLLISIVGTQNASS